MPLPKLLEMVAVDLVAKFCSVPYPLQTVSVDLDLEVKSVIKFGEIFNDSNPQARYGEGAVVDDLVSRLNLILYPCPQIKVTGCQI